MKIDDPLLRRLMNSWPVARLATVSGSGAPHAVPIVFIVEGAHLYSPIDGKLKRGTPLKRLRNIEENSTVTVLLDDYHPNWQRLWWVRLDGEAELFVPDVAKARVLEKLLLGKYPQYQDRTLLPRDVHYLRITWRLKAVWAQSGDPSPVIEQAIGELTDTN
ncbi:MAG: TIGR03668 family PPOX class F420-dependent oxidoreductase [Gammaproteobacteria bacterium]|nr:TIGR03668 family PPOX class F420-dependent oxidoreductase [Gammaproteobacteria bacterium]